MQKQQLSPFGKPEYVLHFQQIPSSLLWLFFPVAKRFSDPCPASFRIWLPPLFTLFTESTLKISIILLLPMKTTFPSFEVVPSFSGDRSLRGWSLRSQTLTLLLWSRRFNIRAFWVRVVTWYRSRRAWGKNEWISLLIISLSYKTLTILSTSIKYKNICIKLKDGNAKKYPNKSSRHNHIHGTSLRLLFLGVCSLVVESRQVQLTPERISTLDEFVSLVQKINSFTICRGISDKKFATLIAKRGGGGFCIFWLGILF